MLPLVAALIQGGLSLFAGVVQTQGADFIKDKLGVDVTKLVGTEEGMIKLKSLEMQHQEFLIQAAQASEGRELDYFKAEVEDRKSARENFAEVAVSAAAPWYDKALLPVMAVLTTVGFFGSMGALFYVSVTGTKLDDNSRDILIYAFGSMTAGWMVVMNFLFGTSRGSRDNQAALATIAKGRSS